MVGILVYVWAVLVAWGLSRIYSGRGTFIMVGAMLGTIMAANVLMIIIPNQRKIVDALLAGRAPDPALGERGKQRSLHNNYFTLPVLFIMISNHYPITFGGAGNWLILAALAAIAIAVRHYFNLSNRGNNQPWILPAAAVAMIALAFVATPPRAVPAGAAAAGRVPFQQVAQVIHSRCAVCHAAHPTQDGFDAPPKGVMFEQPQQIAAQAQAIYAQAVATQTMPLGNLTEMTPNERQLVGRWVEQGAAVD
jgi:uncharacterized membrane protein